MASPCYGACQKRLKLEVLYCITDDLGMDKDGSEVVICGEILWNVGLFEEIT